MAKGIKQKKQDLGIFYTDQRIADFVFDILEIWKEKEEKETGRWESRKHFPSVIDPAVGEGVFLKTAVESGFTKTDWIFGIDIDGDVVKKWKNINLLKEFGGKESDLEAHFFHQNGLDRIHWEQHTEKYRYKLKQKDIEDQQFNLVVGNPPYGGLGIYEEMKMLSESVLSARKVQKVYTQKLDTLFGEEEERVSKITTTEHVKLPLSQVKIFELKELSKSLINLEIWKDKKYLPQRINHNLNINGIDINLKDILTLKEIERLKSYPVEILFIERFIQLAKPGGWIAIIIPDGILTNSNSHYVREFVSEKAKVEAIISLPRDAFKNVGTSAKTSILFLQKYKNQEKKQKDYPIFLASVDSLIEKSFNSVRDNYKNYYNKIMGNKNLVQTTTDEKGREIVMVRVDKTLTELMEEKPTSRWDPAYWHPSFEEVLSQIKNGLEITPLEELLEEPIIAPDHVRASKGEKIGKKFSCEYRTLKDLMFTGLNYAEINYCSENACQRLKRTQLKVGDILFAGSGVGAIGRLGLVERVSSKSCVGDLFIIRNPKVSFCYIYIYLLTEFGQSQIEKIFHGISSAKISTKEIGQIKVPLISNEIQQQVESEYNKMSKYHDKAIEAKKKGNDSEYKANMTTAEKMLKDLIAKTEAVIRGEKKDII